MPKYVGIDIGSVAVSVVLLEADGTILKSFYEFHQGLIRKTLRRMLENIEIGEVDGVGAALSGPEFLCGVSRWDNQIAIIAAVKKLHPRVGSILFVGAENFGLITFNAEGDYESYRTNSPCAAGTGSFLDQQAKRLNISSIDTLSRIAFCNQGDTPKIATRCAVFAKTDLIHAQQQGYSVGQISDALCEGLAKNVIDTLTPDKSIRTPLIFAGGVSLNQAVVEHFRRLLQTDPQVDENSHLYGAIGAALLHAEDASHRPWRARSWDDLFLEEKREKTYGFPPLELKESQIQDSYALQSYLYQPRNMTGRIEVEIYLPLKQNNEAYLGIDIGSTSTKAVLLDRQAGPLVGLYTATAGQPLKAVQAIFEALEDIGKNHACEFSFLGVGTTGSGRKFIGRIINADAVIDEITAHARAAYELNPEVDTIIEIGGQDAKFTTMKDGMVTSSIMNNVCAAGTGSFIEEQSLRLGVPLEEYAKRAMNVPAPAASDRCTVFMERDINNYLMEGYSVEEILATVLHAVCENYLTKVAEEANIGQRICFQGATARNRALVAAFEQRLKKPLFVSRLCHLTGALGAALILRENQTQKTNFRGLGLHKEAIPVEIEICRLCHNNCKISKVALGGEIVAFGFLCGRDYDTKHYVGPARKRYDLLRERERAFTFVREPNFKKSVKIGIPDGLYLAEEMPLWKHFFHSLGVEVVTDENFPEAIAAGKKISYAEFCAPLTSFFGQAQHLADKCDYLFIPVYLDAAESKEEYYRYYCYYSQFAAALVSGNKSLELKNKVIMPVVDYHSFQSRIELFTLLKPILAAGYWEIYNAYTAALNFYNEGRTSLANIYKREKPAAGDIGVVLLGRPYGVMKKTMNKGIPDVFTGLHIKTFYQDMLPVEELDLSEIDELLKRFHWHYAAKILAAALFTARTEGLYPVYVTSFKCSPDSFTTEYFKRIMDKYGKPYLILELDEHDSNVGYETRIEAAVRSFKNHARKSSSHRPARTSPLPLLPLNIQAITKIRDKTLLLPCFDPLCTKLLEAVLLKEGIDARMVPLTEKTLRRGLRTNRGQCIPVNLIAQSYIDYIEDNLLDPGQTAVWSFESRRVACNIRMYPQMIKGLMESHGRGMEKVDIYIGNLSFADISLSASVEAYFAYMFGGMLRRIGCKIRPYEKLKGMTDKVITESLNILYNTLLGGRNKDEDLAKVINLFKRIEKRPGKRPQVAIFGDLYARDNDVFNQQLIHCIEEYGGEVITTPLNEFAKLVATPYIRRWFMEGEFISALYARTMMALVSQLEKSYYKMFHEFAEEFALDSDINYGAIYDYFHIKPQHCGESADNLIKIVALARHYPELTLFVQTNPAFCAAGLITEAMVPRIEAYTGIPVVTLCYDGTAKNINQRIRPYIKFPRKVNLEPALWL